MPRRNKNQSERKRILKNTNRLRKELSRIKSWFAGRWKKDNRKEKDLLDQKYRLRRKGFTLLMEDLKQRITAKGT